MGLIRFLLALGVVIAHSKTLFGLRFTGGLIAVQSFYMISGFYMTLILNEKYIAKGTTKLFYGNRLLRLYPVYITTFLITITICLIAGFSYDNFLCLEPLKSHISTFKITTTIAVFFTNIFLIGQDILMFLGLNENGGIFFTSSFSKVANPMYRFLLIPQAWTISLELLFYLLAPFLVRRKVPLVILIILICFAFRFIAYNHFGINNDPWTYRFFPFELGFFMFGTLAYKIYVKIKEVNIPKYISWSTLIGLAIYIIGFEYIPLAYQIKQWIFYFLVFIGIPILFILTKSNKLDYKIGEFSYPIYISHLTVIMVITAIRPSAQYLGEIASLITILFSFLLIKTISDPVEKLRKKRFENA